MNIDEFSLDIQEELKKFNEFWRKGHQKSEHMFPDELEPGEWQEQFFSFSSDDKNDNP